MASRNHNQFYDDTSDETDGEQYEPAYSDGYDSASARRIYDEPAPAPRYNAIVDAASFVTTASRDGDNGDGVGVFASTAQRASDVAHDARGEPAVGTGDGGVKFMDPPPLLPPPPATPTNAFSPPRPPDTPQAGSGLLGACAGVVCEALLGVLEIAKMVTRTLNEALFSTAFHLPVEDAARTSTVQGRLLFIVLLESWILAMQVAILAAVGITGDYADVVHARFLYAQAAALVAVPLGLYIYVFGGLDPATPSAQRVFTLYTVCEGARLVGDVYNLVRFALAFDDAAHLAAAIAPDIVPTLAAWDHGVCGRPHSVTILLLVACAVGAVASSMNVVALVYRHRMHREHAAVKARPDDAPTSSSYTAVNMEPAGPGRVRHRAGRPSLPAHAPVYRAPVPRRHPVDAFEMNSDELNDSLYLAFD